MDSEEYSYGTVIRQDQVDAMGHLNHASYLSVFEEARWDICHAQNVTIESMQTRGVGLVVIEAHIQYRREVKAGESVIIRTRFRDVHRKLWRVEQTMENTAGQLCSSVAIKGGMFDLKERKMLLADDEWRAVFLGQRL